MTFKDEGNQISATHPLVKLTATFRRIISMTEVVHDTIEPWLKGRRAKDVIEFSDINAEAIGVISVNLLKHFIVAEMLLGLQTESRQEFESLCREAEQDAEGAAKSKLVDESALVLSLVSRFAKETTDQVRCLATAPTEWVVKRGFDRDLASLDRTLRSLDHTRWQILKGFAKLVVIIDDHEDPAPDGPCDALREDQPAMNPD
jgi:hypothetical protein